MRRHARCPHGTHRSRGRSRGPRALRPPRGGAAPAGVAPGAAGGRIDESGTSRRLASRTRSRRAATLQGVRVGEHPGGWSLTQPGRRRRARARPQVASTGPPHEPGGVTIPEPTGAGRSDGRGSTRWPSGGSSTMRPSERYPIYAGNVGEVFPDPVTPFSASFAITPYSEPGWRTPWCARGSSPRASSTPDHNGSSASSAVLLPERLHQPDLRRAGAGHDPEMIDLALYGSQPGIPPYEPQPGDDDGPPTAAFQWLIWIADRDRAARAGRGGPHQAAARGAGRPRR